MSEVIVGKGMHCYGCGEDVQERLEECDECGRWRCEECIDRHADEECDADE